MKSTLFPRMGAFFFAMVFVAGSAFRPATISDTGGTGTRVFIDGKEVRPEGMITLKKDDTILLEAEGLKPNSEVYIKVKKAGIKWVEDTFVVNDSGTVKEFLDVPERNLTVNCTVNYYSATDGFQTAEFKLRVD